MALSQDERLAISKKIVQIPAQDAAADQTISQIGVEVAKAQKEDNANKALMDEKTTLINLYQKEVQNYDGNGRNELLEQDMVDAANRTLQNFFFPNDPKTATPSNSDGVWKQFVAFANTKAVGKTYLEVYSSVQKEQDLIDSINTYVTLVEAMSAITRSTGQSCNSSGTCSLPAFTTQTTCVTGGGTWTTGPDVISNDAAMQSAGTNLIAAVNAWKTFITTTRTYVPTTDSDATRSAQNDASRSDIDSTLAAINTWLALSTYNTSHGQTTCVGFNSYNVSLLGPTKFIATELNTLKSKITSRVSFVTTRTTQINGYLGSVVQDLSTGQYTSATGFYGARVRIIDMRLNAMGGSLSKLKGLQRGQDAQNQSKLSNANAAAVYTSVMFCSAFRAPSTGTKTIHVMDGSGFTVGQTVYVAAENQEEIQTTITAVSTNTITLSDVVPAKYRQDSLARLYTIL